MLSQCVVINYESKVVQQSYNCNLLNIIFSMENKDQDCLVTDKREKPLT